MGDPSLDRSEAATPYKLKKARDKGQVGKSAEVVTAAVFTVSVVYLYWKGWDGLVAQFRYDAALLTAAGRIEPSPAALWHLTAGMVVDTAALLAPFFGVLAIAAVVANLVQTGPVLSFEPVKPDFDRINPMSGLRRIFSLRTLFDAARAIVKLVLLAAVVYEAIEAMVPQFFHLSSITAAAFARELLERAAGIGLRIALLLCLVAAVDWMFTRREFGRKMRMSRKELRDEHKEREGDPRIRARLRELRREALRRSMAVRRTSSADVVLTNPTHVAVALRYVHGQMQSPQLVAKGAGTLAASMRKVAAHHRIPVVQNPPLARELYRTLEVEQHVPPAFYAQVARILVWVFAMRDAQRRRGAEAAA